jgi:monoamine oxidase
MRSNQSYFPWISTFALATALAFFLQTATGQTSPTPRAVGGADCTRTTGYDTIVIGAGLAGLSAARELSRLNRSVLILEANDRIGGRGFVGLIGDGQVPIDYGGAWLHGIPTNPLTGLADSLGFIRARTDLEAPYYVDGRRADAQQMKRFEEALTQFEDSLSLAASAEEAHRALEDYTCGATARPATSADLCREIRTSFPSANALTRLCKNPKKTTPEELCRAVRKASSSERDVAAEHIPMAPDFENIRPLLIANSGPLESAAELKKTSAVDASHFEAGEDDLLDKGMGAFVVKFGEGLPACLNSRVSGLKYTTEGVEVQTSSTTYKAANALVTVSVGVLAAAPPKGITFVPPLPKTKKDAIDALQMGEMQKVIIPFKDDIFPAGITVNSWVLTQSDLSAEALRFAQDRNLTVTNGKLVMAFVMKPLASSIAIGFFGGDWAKALEGQCTGAEFTSGPASKSGCDSMAIGIARTALSKMFGKDRVDRSILTDRIQVTRWSLDPTSYGAYSVATPGNWHQHEILAEPLTDTAGAKRLFFAGEGTARAIYNGSYPGAYESGLKAAREIHAAMLATHK